MSLMIILHVYKSKNSLIEVVTLIGPKNIGDNQYKTQMFFVMLHLL